MKPLGKFRRALAIDRFIDVKYNVTLEDKLFGKPCK
jgi:hypothetical protein